MPLGPREIEREPLENILKSSNLREDGTLTNQPDMKSLVHKLHTEMNALDEEDAADLTVSKVDEQRETFEFLQNAKDHCSGKRFTTHSRK